MKKCISLFCTLALVMSMIVPSVGAAEENTCCCGATDVTWETLTADTELTAGGHYRLAGNISRRLTASFAGTICVDLAGYTLSGNAKVANLGNNATNGSPATVLNVMDSSAKQTGVIQGYGGSGNAGGLIYIYKGATFNLYGGTIKPSTTDVVAYCGGVFAVYGTLNVYGGTVIGGKLGGTSSQPHVGGTVCVQSDGEVNFYGGNVISGTAESDAKGHCVYVKKNGKATISGNANVDQIALESDYATAMTVSGTFTGSAELLLPAEVTAGSVIAVSDNAAITGRLTVAGSTLAVMTSGNSVVVGDGSWCEACKTNVVWQDLSESLTDTSAGHYKLTKDVAASQLIIKNGTKICLDLNGYTYASSSRAFVVGASYSGGAGEVLNIMDSSAEKTGCVTGRGGSDAMAGGVIYCYNRTTVNIYGGTIEGKGTGGVIAKNGGALDIYGTVNMYGGKVIGNHVANNGGAVCLLSGTANFNVYGGRIIGGKADSEGDCVYVASGAKVILSGDATLDEIYFAGSSASTLTVTGNYTGKVTLDFATAPTAGADVGNVENLTMGKENLAIAGSRMFAVASGDNLVAATLTGAVIEDTYYDTLAAALAAAKAGDTVKLLESVADATTPDAITLDLNGWNIGSLTANGKLSLKDSATDDYTVEDVYGYGKITKATGDIQPAGDYLMLEGNGISFHRYTLKLTKVNLRPGTVGLYYTAAIQMDEVAQELTDSYGVAVSVSATTPALGDGKSLYTVGNSSVLISGIMDGDDTDAVDAATPIYGRPYIKFTDGSCVYGKTYSTSLQQVTEAVDKLSWGNITLAQNRALTAMYDTYKAEMATWAVTNLHTSDAKKQAAADDGVFKAIVIGNSASVDATSLLAAIFRAEAPEQEFVLGCMYESGCSVKGHVGFLQDDAAAYTYYKNTGSDEFNRWTLYSGSTLQDGLTDQNWDVVIFQELHTVSGLLSTFTDNDNLETLITYVVDQLGYEPKLTWHSVGIIPEIPEAYANYVMSLEGDDGGGTDAGENEGWVDDGTSQPEDMAWIFDVARPGYPVTWAKNYIKNFGNDAQTMYDAICDVAVNYIMPSEIYSFDDVIPGGSVIQYARNMGMTDRDLFRDYAHKSDYGRVLIGYVWYASLMGITEFDSLAYTTVPKEIRHSKSPKEDLVLTQEQYDMALAAVNYALANPFDSPTPVSE